MVTGGRAPIMPALLLESVIWAPPLGAGPDKVSVPVEGWPELTVVGDKVRLLSVIGRTNRNHVSKLPPRLPSPLGSRRPMWVEPSKSFRVVPNASPSRYKVGSFSPQITSPLRLMWASMLAGSFRFCSVNSPSRMTSRDTRPRVRRIWLEVAAFDKVTVAGSVRGRTPQ